MLPDFYFGGIIIVKKPVPCSTQGTVRCLLDADFVSPHSSCTGEETGLEGLGSWICVTVSCRARMTDSWSGFLRSVPVYTHILVLTKIKVFT